MLIGVNCMDCAFDLSNILHSFAGVNALRLLFASDTAMP
jgi:hypothetical protein